MPLYENITKPATSIAERIFEIREKIRTAALHVHRNPSDITLVAVSKTHPDEAVRDAIAAQQLHFGENRMQDLAARLANFSDQPELNWHMIGTLQSNKLKMIAPAVAWIHSAAKVSHLEEIEKQAAKNNREIQVLIQVNISQEEQKSGCVPEELPAILDAACNCNFAKVRGFMGMAAFVNDERTVRNQFSKLRTLLETHGPAYRETLNLNQLSMGMTHDFPWAIAEGATILRIGSAIFGNR
jgi:pyridoxal phosphate enzyme (YggS family)